MGAKVQPRNVKQGFCPSDHMHALEQGRGHATRYRSSLTKVVSSQKEYVPRVSCLSNKAVLSLFLSLSLSYNKKLD